MTNSRHALDLRGERTSPAVFGRELWAARSLVVLLARKEFVVRFRRTTFGALWAVALPLTQAVVLAIVLSRLVGKGDLAGDIDVPFAVFVFSGMVAWTFFSSAVADGSTAIVDGAAMSTKIYFPRLVFPLVVIGANTYGLIVGTVLLLVMSTVSGTPLGLHTLLVVPALLLVMALAAAFASVLSAIHVYARDVRFIVGAALLPGFYLTPVFYRLEQAGSAADWLRLNPMAGAVELLRAGTIGASNDLGLLVLISLGWIAALTVVAVVLHLRYDRVFADLL
jgi:ABC-type polysaccharide/polyol phosphate export permease